MNERNLDTVGWPVIGRPPNDDLVSNFDRLVEQQDQEIARDGFVSPATQIALQNLTEQDYIPSPAPKKDYSWLKQIRAEREQDQGPEWDDWEL
jgi:hypothetical protein